MVAKEIFKAVILLCVLSVAVSSVAGILAIVVEAVALGCVSFNISRVIRLKLDFKKKQQRTRTI